MQQGLPVAPGVQTLEVDVPYAADGHVIVDVSATSLTPSMLSQFNGLSREVKETGPRNLQLHVELSHSGTDRGGARRPLRAAAAESASPRASARRRRATG